MVSLSSSLRNHDLSLLEYPAPRGRGHAGEQQQAGIPGDLPDHRPQSVSRSPSQVGIGEETVGRDVGNAHGGARTHMSIHYVVNAIVHLLK